MRRNFEPASNSLETDRLSNPRFAFPTMTLRGGIEMDLYGKPLAYCTSGPWGMRPI